MLIFDFQEGSGLNTLLTDRLRRFLPSFHFLGLSLLERGDFFLKISFLQTELMEHFFVLSLELGKHFLLKGDQLANLVVEPLAE